MKEKRLSLFLLTWLAALCLWASSFYGYTQENRITQENRHAKEWQEPSQDVLAFFPTATRTLPKEKDLAIIPVYQLNSLLGYVFESDDLTHFPGFSGETVNLNIGLDVNGVLRGIKVQRHHEPIFLHGLGEEPMLAFIAQYLNHNIQHRFLVGSKQNRTHDGKTQYFDGVTKATVSVMVINDTILNSARKVARLKLDGFGRANKRVAQFVMGSPKRYDFQQLKNENLVLSWQATLGEFAQQLSVPESRAEDWLENPEAHYALNYHLAFLNPPQIGKSLLGDSEYQRLMSELEPGEIALLLSSSGGFSPLAEDFVPGTTPTRFSVTQQGISIDIRDQDFYSFFDPNLVAGFPDFEFIKVFRLKSSSGFDPALPVTFQLNVPVKKSFLEYEVKTVSQQYDIPNSLWGYPAIKDTEPMPLWQQIWQQRQFETGMIMLYLAIVTCLFVKQKYWVTFPKYFPSFRLACLMFTLFFLGFYAQGQLSVVNIYTLLLSVWNGFEITVFLLDPVIFVLWLFVFVSLFLWGRGVFCGWLCPFGALQELIGLAAKKWKIKQWTIQPQIHSKLQRVKYPVLVILVVTSFSSLTLAENLAELEPFKTAITLWFVRDWYFVVYALLLLFIALKIHKVYCRYLCPLGAGLAVLGKFRLFSWLNRKKECGSPCQLCRKACDIDAINLNGSIDYNECVQCLECVVIAADNNRCVVEKYGAKKRRRQKHIPMTNITHV
ncbi:4Fe-4S binding protein [Vibrio sp. S9_S30]|nr:4Fe-4S binding protein [Vibrio sp. S9_S30]